RGLSPIPNIFVADVIRESGASVPNIVEGNHPPRAAQWGNSAQHIENWVVISDPIPGAVGSDAHHVGIVTPNGQNTISVIGSGPVGQNDWGFRQGQQMIWRGYTGP
ncbi:MAG: hypothetical protein KAR13_23040, partial [Desulfobulbaceae bacterium]|nr:hypothetical protein [Desulfobulbaceae bacterium]